MPAELPRAWSCGPADPREAVETAYKAVHNALAAAEEFRRSLMVPRVYNGRAFVPLPNGHAWLDLLAACRNLSHPVKVACFWLNIGGGVAWVGDRAFPSYHEAAVDYTLSTVMYTGAMDKDLGNISRMGPWNATSAEDPLWDEQIMSDPARAAAWGDRYPGLSVRQVVNRVLLERGETLAEGLDEACGSMALHGDLAAHVTIEYRAALTRLSLHPPPPGMTPTTARPAKRVGRPPRPQTAALKALCRQLKAEGKPTKEIVARAQAEFGDEFEPETIKAYCKPSRNSPPRGGQ